MGEYLLKGHKMLATTCERCSTIEMQDKQGKVYCIACTEIDTDENAKDDPAVSDAAASQTIAESSVRSDAEPAAAVAAIMARLPPSSNVGDGGSVAEVTVKDSMDVVIQKLRRATQALAVTDNVEQSRNYVALIKDCADAIISLRKAES